MSGDLDRPRTGTWALGMSLTLLVGVTPQFLLGALGPQLRVALDMSAADIGVMFSFVVGSAVLAAPVLGRLIDRTGGRIGSIALLTVSGASMLAASFATSRTSLLVALIPAGFAMAAANPATNRWATAAESPRLQSLLVGVAQASVQAGALGAGLLASSVALGLDWRGSMRIASCLAVLGLLVAAYAPSDGPGLVRRRPTRAEQRATDTGPGGDLTRLRRRVQLALGGYALLMGACTSLGITYLPTYAVDRVGLSIAGAGATTAVYGSVAVLMRIALGAAIRDPDRLLAPVLTALALGAATSLALIAAADGRSVVLLWVGTALFGATGTSWTMVAFLGIVRVSAPGTAGVITGWVTAAFYTGLGGAPLVGAVLLRNGDYSTVWTLAMVFAVLSVAPAAGTRGLARVAT